MSSSPDPVFGCALAIRALRLLMMFDRYRPCERREAAERRASGSGLLRVARKDV
ncbi:hypothetical protein [Labrys sp. (in: a-proteobacteria)]|uniref:hypothetical protein n=1 Tax=Labrys sp. (in: a-proteobacteria) TaxID=1917972 RepID=UPI0039E4D404